MSHGTLAAPMAKSADIQLTAHTFNYTGKSIYDSLNIMKIVSAVALIDERNIDNNMTCRQNVM